jgi:penicillin-binding protein-related factor A (putative recombinase)
MRPRSPSRIASGRAAKAAGDAWEALIEEHHDRALKRGIISHAIHNQASSDVIGGRLQYVAKGGADYSLILNNGHATSVIAELKSCEGHYLPRSEIQAKQAQHLDASASAGGLAFLLVEFRIEGGPFRFCVPWKQAPWKVKKSAESVDVSDLGEWLIEGDCYLSKFFVGTGIPSVTAPRRFFPRE